MAHLKPKSHLGSKKGLHGLVIALATVSVFALSSYGSGANADQITLGDSSPNAWDIAGTGNSGPLSVTASGSFTTPALFQSDIGTATFGPLSLTTAGGSNGVFPVVAGGAESLSILFQDGDEISGTVDWANLNNGSLNPHADGTFDYTASGDAAFMESFQPTGVSEIDITFKQTQMTLEDWNTDTGVTLSSGEINDQGVPEPSTLVLFGVGLGLLGVGLWHRNRNRASDLAQDLQAV